MGHTAGAPPRPPPGSQRTHELAPQCGDKCAPYCITTPLEEKKRKKERQLLSLAMLLITQGYYSAVFNVFASFMIS